MTGEVLGERESRVAEEYIRYFDDNIRQSQAGHRADCRMPSGRRYCTPPSAGILDGRRPADGHR